MARSVDRAKRKPSGGRYKDYRKKRVYQLASNPTHTLLGERVLRTARGRGGNEKQKLLKGNVVNVIGKDGKAMKATIKTVVENKANLHFVRRNIITKGCVVDTDKGKVRVTSRPGQEGTINGVLVAN